MNFTFRQLSIFESVARNLNYTTAARELHLSQPAVSQQIKQLEEQTEIALLERIGKKIYLTEAGKALYEYAITTLSQKKDIEETIEQLKDLQTGHLHIAVVSTANHFVIRLLAAFAQHYPKIQISLDVTNRSDLLQLLANNECDWAIMGQPPLDRQIEATHFLDNPLVVIAACQHPLVARAQKIPLKRLSEEKFIVREQGSGTRRAIEKFFNQHQLPFHTTMVMSNNRAIKHAVEEGLGLAIVSLHTLEIELRANSLKVLDVAHFPIMRKWYLVQNRNKQLPPIARVFREFLLSHAAQSVYNDDRNEDTSKINTNDASCS